MKDPFLSYLSKILSEAKKGKNSSLLEKYKKYYLGNVPPKTGTTTSGASTYGVEKSGSSYYNIIKPIIETKATIAMDSMITTNVKPKRFSHQTIDALDTIETISDLLNDSWEAIKKSENMENISQQVIRDGAIYGIGIAKVFWDKSKSGGLGDVGIDRVSPLNFFPEPGATSIENCNYIFIRKVVSRFDLINQYKGNRDILDKIDKLSAGDPFSEYQSSDKHTGGVSKLSNNGQETTNYLLADNNEEMFSNPPTNIEIWECYLKDDTLLIETNKDSSSEKKMKQSQKLKYPNGRLVIFSGSVILEDRPIDYPFGFPLSVYSPIQTDDLIGKGDVEDLMMIQARITNAYQKLNELIVKYKSILIIPKKYKNEFLNNSDLIWADPGDGSILQQTNLITNKLTADIQIIRNHIEDLKKDAYRISRVNEIMLYGERPTGVNSGQMVRDLMESPLSSIREIQRNFKTFLVSLSNKAIVLIQLYYNQPRILRASGGKKFVSIAPDENGQTKINIYDQDMETKQLMAVQEINSDLTLGEYEIELTSGSSLPQSRSAIASTTLQLAQQGIFGDINDPDVKEHILKSLDYPNYRGIINNIKAKSDEMIATPPPKPDFKNYVKGINMSLKDLMDLIKALPVESQASAISEITRSLGIPIAPQSPNIDTMGQMQGMTAQPPEMPPYMNSIGDQLAF